MGRRAEGRRGERGSIGAHAAHAKPDFSSTYFTSTSALLPAAGGHESGAGDGTGMGTGAK